LVLISGALSPSVSCKSNKVQSELFPRAQNKRSSLLNWIQLYDVANPLQLWKVNVEDNLSCHFCRKWSNKIYKLDLLWWSCRSII